MATVDQQEAARQALRSWRRRSDAVAADRDQLVVTAIAEAALSKEEVHILTRLGRTTIDRIMAKGSTE